MVTSQYENTHPPHAQKHALKLTMFGTKQFSVLEWILIRMSYLDQTLPKHESLYPIGRSTHRSKIDKN